MRELVLVVGAGREARGEQSAAELDRRSEPPICPGARSGPSAIIVLIFILIWVRCSPMLVCHCKSVCERQIREVVRSGARTRAQVARACAAGTRCGGCTTVLEQIISSERRALPPSSVLAPGGLIAAAAR